MGLLTPSWSKSVVTCLLIVVWLIFSVVKGPVAGACPGDDYPMPAFESQDYVSPTPTPVPLNMKDTIHYFGLMQGLHPICSQASPASLNLADRIYTVELWMLIVGGAYLVACLLSAGASGLRKGKKARTRG
jgi:hypothetical protein